MKYKYAYPAIFRYSEEEKDMPFDVSFPDILGGVTCGTDFDNAMYMAKDLLKLMLTSALAQCSRPTPVKTLQRTFPGEMIVLVEVELDEEIDYSYLDK